MAANWGKVEVAVEMAKGIAFDTCHKIYVLMDDGQMAQMKEYGYDDGDPNEGFIDLIPQCADDDDEL